MPTATFESVRIDTRAFAKTFVQNATCYGKVKTAYLPVSLLYVNYDYQRMPQRKINRIAANFDENKCGFLKVSYHEDSGSFAILDGQNRYIAAKQAGIVNLPCQILVGLTAEEEALVFAKQDENKTKVSAYANFNALVFAKDEIAVAIKAICDEYDVSTQRRSDTLGPTIKSLSQTTKIYKTVGENGLRWVLEVIQRAGWHHAKNAYSSHLMAAIMNIYKSHLKDSGEVLGILSNLLRSMTPYKLEAMAKLRYVGCSGQAAMTSLIEDALADKVILTIEEGEC